ncbi:hypothetical protein VKT23_005887 [Stygiomarasmius scandens]|uniref:Uncharacterized protein n=1 Tax=Marasmiellus scandens TaxID=2682957 RepID=A0ABR1JQ02_9AGAR
MLGHAALVLPAIGDLPFLMYQWLWRFVLSARAVTPRGRGGVSGRGRGGSGRGRGGKGPRQQRRGQGKKKAAKQKALEAAGQAEDLESQFNGMAFMVQPNFRQVINDNSSPSVVPTEPYDSSQETDEDSQSSSDEGENNQLVLSNAFSRPPLHLLDTPVRLPANYEIQHIPIHRQLRRQNALENIRGSFTTPTESSLLSANEWENRFRNIESGICESFFSFTPSVHPNYDIQLRSYKIRTCTVLVSTGPNTARWLPQTEYGPYKMYWDMHWDQFNKEMEEGMIPYGLIHQHLEPIFTDIHMNTVPPQEREFIMTDENHAAAEASINVERRNEEQARGYFDEPLEYASDKEEEEAKDDAESSGSDSSKSEYSSESEQDSVEGSEMAIMDISSLKQEDGSENEPSDYEMDDDFEVVQSELIPEELAQREREEYQARLNAWEMHNVDPRQWDQAWEDSDSHSQHSKEKEQTVPPNSREWSLVDVYPDTPKGRGRYNNDVAWVHANDNSKIDYNGRYIPKWKLKDIDPELLNDEPRNLEGLSYEHLDFKYNRTKYENTDYAGYYTKVYNSCSICSILPKEKKNFAIHELYHKPQPGEALALDNNVKLYTIIPWNIWVIDERPFNGMTDWEKKDRQEWLSHFIKSNMYINSKALKNIDDFDRFLVAFYTLNECEQVEQEDFHYNTRFWKNINYQGAYKEARLFEEYLEVLMHRVRFIMEDIVEKLHTLDYEDNLTKEVKQELESTLWDCNKTIKALLNRLSFYDMTEGLVRLLFRPTDVEEDLERFNREEWRNNFYYWVLHDRDYFFDCARLVLADLPVLDPKKPAPVEFETPYPSTDEELQLLLPKKVETFSSELPGPREPYLSPAKKGEKHKLETVYGTSMEHLYKSKRLLGSCNLHGSISCYNLDQTLSNLLYSPERNKDALRAAVTESLEKATAKMKASCSPDKEEVIRQIKEVWKTDSVGNGGVVAGPSPRKRTPAEMLQVSNQTAWVEISLNNFVQAQGYKPLVTNVKFQNDVPNNSGHTWHKYENEHDGVWSDGDDYDWP